MIYFLFRHRQLALYSAPSNLTRNPSRNPNLPTKPYHRLFYPRHLAAQTRPKKPTRENATLSRNPARQTPAAPRRRARHGAPAAGGLAGGAGFGPPEKGGSHKRGELLKQACGGGIERRQPRSRSVDAGGRLFRRIGSAAVLSTCSRLSANRG